MNVDRGESTVPVTVEEALDAVGPTLRGDDGEFAPGASLLVVSHCRRNGVLLDERACTVLARYLDLTDSEMTALIAFHDRAVNSEGDPSGEISICLGTSCTLHGASQVHPMVKAELEAQGMERPYTEVFCLGHCEFGPSMMLGRDTYCAGIQKVVSDDRDWRANDSGPVAIEDETVPVRD